MTQLVDLHAHTNASDGSLTPAALVDLAREKGLAALAVTDHDTVAGLDEALARGEEIGQRVIPGIELATSAQGRDVHLVGLFLDHHSPALARELETLAKTRDQRNRRMVERLHQAGLPISWEDMLPFVAAGTTLTKAHIGAVLIQRGAAGDLREAIAKYMAKGAPGYVKRENPPPEKCLEIIHAAGGLAFVAHTNQIIREDRDASQAICRSLLELGADGLETLYCEYDEDWRRRTKALAEEFGCLESGGSDFHGSFKKGLELGSGYGDLAVPGEFLARMGRAG